MDPIADLLPPAGALSDPAADSAVAALRGAYEAGPSGAVDERLAGWLDRMGQARDKIRSGAKIARTAELITLAQFGAGSAGRALAGACDDKDAEAVCERLCIGLFLVDIVARPDRFAALLPPAGDSDGILRRAADALQTTAGIRHAGLARHMRRQVALSRRRIEKLQRYGSADPRSALTRFDRFAVAVRLCLRGKHAS